MEQNKKNCLNLLLMTLMRSQIFDDDVIGGIRDDIHFCAGGDGKDTCQVKQIS